MEENHMVTGEDYGDAYPDVQDCEHCDGKGKDPIEEGDCYICDGDGEVSTPGRHWNKVLIKKNKIRRNNGKSKDYRAKK